jgi:hypothetical protein
MADRAAWRFWSKRIGAANAFTMAMSSRPLAGYEYSSAAARDVVLLGRMSCKLAKGGKDE